MAISVVVKFEVIDVDHQKRQFALVLLGLHPFEIEPALEAAPVGEARQHVERGDDGEAVVGRAPFLLALAEFLGHTVGGRRQRHELPTPSGPCRTAPPCGTMVPAGSGRGARAVPALLTTTAETPGRPSRLLIIFDIQSRSTLARMIACESLLIADTG